VKFRAFADAPRFSPPVVVACVTPVVASIVTVMALVFIASPIRPVEP
jgi:hypothetical protein